MFRLVEAVLSRNHGGDMELLFRVIDDGGFESGHLSERDELAVEE